MIRIFLTEPVVDPDTSKQSFVITVLTLPKQQNYEITDDKILTIYKNPEDDTKAYVFNFDKVIYLEITPSKPEKWTLVEGGKAPE